MKPLWSTKQVAEYLGLQEATLRHWRRVGRGPAYIQVSRGVIRYDPASVFAWLWANTHGAQPQTEVGDVDDPDEY